MNELKSYCPSPQAIPGVEMTTIDRLTHQEFHLTFRPVPGEKPAEMIRRLALVVHEREGSVVRHEIFGAIGAHPQIIAALQREFGHPGWPVHWVEGHPGTGQGISGMHVLAVAGVRVDTLELGGRPIGRVFRDGGARHCLLGDIRPANLDASRPHQFLELFENLEGALHETGMNMANVMRTWFFLDDILAWYEPFNAVRNEFYHQRKVFKGVMPASTGIGGRNPVRAAIVAGAWAVQAIEAPVAVQEVPSPLQCPSWEYGSAFSRAVLLAEPAGRRLLLSGTASIEPNGRSAHVGDVDRQIALTMEVAHAVLASRGFEFSDVTRATAYFRNIQDAPAFYAWRQEQRVEPFPLVMTESTICRDELLFEIELDAFATRQDHEHRVTPQSPPAFCLRGR